MMTEENATPLSKKEQKELSAILDTIEYEDDYKMTIHELHGFITGVICGPKIMLPHEWIHELFFDATNIEANKATSKMMNFFERIYNQTSLTIDDKDNLPKEYFPAHPDNITEDPDYEAIATWCSGFHDAIAMDEEWMEDEAFFAFMVPILISKNNDDQKMLNELCSDTNFSSEEYKALMIKKINESIFYLFRYVLNVKFCFGGRLPDDLLEDIEEYEDEHDEEEEVILH